MKRTNNESVSPALGIASILGLSVLATVGVRGTNKAIDKASEIYDGLAAATNPQTVSVKIEAPAANQTANQPANQTGK